ncbi:MAG: hypothetical protein R3234_00780 [Thermoanaerobaculia bacterium]|nr:hypothetical protein [Thermoanaerobaculia bacterium]
MAPEPTQLTLELLPRSRYDVIDVTRRVEDEYGGLLADYPRALYCSYHTTAGYLEQSLARRLEHSRQYLDPFIRLFQRLFPPGAEYHHDQLERREELSDAQRAREPKNADSHLTFIGSGLENCVTYVHRGGTPPVYFIDLDGVVPDGSRTRRTTVLPYREERVVGERGLRVPVSDHPIDALNLRDDRLGIFDELGEWARSAGIERGRLDLSLAVEESHAGLTVNEYETLLMQNDLAEVLRNPLRFAAAKGRNILRDPLAVPGKTLSYARYDLVQVFNELMDTFGFRASTVENLLARVLALPASRFLRMKRGVSLLVSGDAASEPIVCGTYQSPILVQWKRPRSQVRELEARLVELV